MKKNGTIEVETLPTEVEIPNHLIKDYEDDDFGYYYSDISDWLSDEFGFCHYGFEMVDSGNPHITM